MSVEKLIADANASGFSIANLYQLMTHPAYLNVPSKPTGEWQCNFRRGRDHYEYGRGDSMEAALKDALRHAGRKHTPPPEKPAEPAKQLSLESLE